MDRPLTLTSAGNVLRHVSILLLVTVGDAQAPNDPLQDFCRRYDHRTAVLGNRLYIDGGMVYANPISQFPEPTVGTFMYSDLWVATDGAPTMRTNVRKNTSIPSPSGGILWPDEINNKFYAFGGFFPRVEPPPFDTWSYSAEDDSWNTIDITGVKPKYVARGMGTVAPESGVGYYLGGYQSNQTIKGWNSAPLYSSDLVSFNMTQMSYSNTSGPDSTGRGEGLMVFLPVSISGLLVYFGGMVQDPRTREIQAASMKDIGIYDIESKTWYTQKSSGHIPEERKQFGGGVSWPSDLSSFNIYIYGGFGFGQNSTGYDDVYILSIPAFVWIKWYPSVNDTQPFPHGGLTCNVINGTQMIVMGGNFTNTSMCDVPTIQGQHTLSLGQNNPSDAEWSEFVEDLTNVKVPPEVINLIGGTSAGGANVTEPINGGWTDYTIDQSNSLFYVFQRKYEVPARSPTPTASPTTIPPNGPSQRSKNNTPVIVGAVLGGVIFIATVSAAYFYVRYRIRRARKAKQATIDVNDKMLDKGEKHENSSRTTVPTELAGKQKLPSELQDVSVDPSQTRAELESPAAELPAH